MKKVLFVFMWTFCINFSFSQTMCDDLINDGAKNFEKKNYLDAIDYYLQATKEKACQDAGLEGLKKCIEQLNIKNNTYTLIKTENYTKLQKELEDCKKSKGKKEDVENLEKSILSLKKELEKSGNDNQRLTKNNNQLALENQRLTDEIKTLKSQVKSPYDLSGHYISFGSGSSYGYFGLNYQYRFEYYALSFGGGYSSVVIGNKCYFSDIEDYLENTYALLNIGYSQKSSSDNGNLFTAILVGYNCQNWQLGKVNVGINCGIGYTYHFSSGSGFAYDIGFVIHF